MRFVPALAVLVTAVALYVSSGVLDQIVTPSGLVRVALLPPWQTLLGFAGVGVLGLSWLHHQARPRGTRATVRPPLGGLVLPAFALLLLVLPYLPVLPDVVPAVQVLAGPVRLVIWVIVIAQLVWTLWQARLVRANWIQHLTRRQLTLIIAVMTACIAGGAATRFVGGVLYPGGDEPHYLVIAQSLWRDGDLKIENNHTRGDYYEYFALPLDPHYLTRGADGEIYSIHPIGMPLLITPIYAAGGYLAVVMAFVLMAALAAAIMWRSAARVINDAGAATFGWAAVVATAPFLFNSFAIYPEIPAAVAVAVAFTLTAVSTSSARWRWPAVGIACAALPWLSTKYAPMSAVLVSIALARLYYSPTSPASTRSAGWRVEPGTLGILAPYALSLAVWFYFFYAIWGTPLPQAPYGALVQTELRYLIFGAPGLLFDQEYGLLPYAPVYILAATGLWIMSRESAVSRRRAIEIVIVFAALLGTVGAFRIWWGGSASPGRPITSGLLLMAIPIAFAFRAAAPASAQRAAQHLLLWSSIALAGVLLFAQEGSLTANGRDGTSSLLAYLSPQWPAWTMVPSFIVHGPAAALAHTSLWLLLAAGAAFALRGVRSSQPGTASLSAMLLTAAALLIAAVVMPRLPTAPGWPALEVRARPRLPVLDAFDTRARPIAIEYAPLGFASPEQIVTHAAVAVEPSWRRQPQPIRVLHNGRFSLPAGRYRVEIDWSGTRAGEVIGLQIGRTGDVLRKWEVDATAGQQWSVEFDIPVDAPFVGLRGSSELEQVIARVRFVPVSIVNASERQRGPAVVAASQSGPASLFYVDLNAAPEPEGFWVLGKRRTRVTFSRPSTEGPLVLRVHSGRIPNRLHVAAFGWQHAVDLVPALPEVIEVPADGDHLVTLEFAADAQFVPSELDPSSTDTRALGVWVEVVK